MQADFSIELGRDDPALEVPWSSDDPSVRYYDLKASPELVVQLPEAVAHPPLRAFLARINTPGFPLATVKCDAWQSREIAPEEEIFGDRKFVAYVDLVFENEANRCSLEKHEEFARVLCRLLGHAPDIAASVELVIRRCYFHRDNVARPASPGLDSPPLCKEMMHDVAVCRDVASRDATSEDIASTSEDIATTNVATEKIASREAANRKAANRETAIRETANRETAPEQLMSGDAVSHTTLSGFSFTAYVTGFGDEENEPRQRWEIALALMQHALIQSSRA